MHYDTLFYMSYSPNFEESPLLIQAGNESRPDRRLGTELHRCLALGWKRSRLFPIKVLAFKSTVTTNGALFEFFTEEVVVLNSVADLVRLFVLS